MSKKLYAFARIAEFMQILKQRMEMKAFIASKFAYCQWVWMFPSRKLNGLVNKLHESTLRIVYQDYAS